MSAQLRPTDPQPPSVPGQVQLNSEILNQVLRAAGLAAVGLYGQICAAAQYHEPCSVELLVHANRGGSEREVRRALMLLLKEGFIDVVEEPEEGGAA